MLKTAWTTLRRLNAKSKVAPSGLESNNGNRGFKILRDADEREIAESNKYCENRFRFHTVKVKQHSIQPKLVSFYDIVSDCDRFREERFKQMYIGRLLNSIAFRISIMVVIILNSIVITVQTDQYLETNFGRVFVALDRIFLTIYVVEILIKWYYDFQTFWRVGWNVFDFVIVAASLFGPSLSFMGGGRILRILRMLRALRSLRSISALRGLQIIVHTIMHSIPDMANIVALLFICMFIFAVLGVSFFGEKCPKYFGSLGRAMFSLFICVTQDGWIGIKEDLKSCGNDILGALYLIVFIMIGAFIFANLVVAVVVTNLEWAIAEQKELEKKEHKYKSGREEDKSIHSLRTDDASDILKLVAQDQEPLLTPEVNPRIKSMEIYFLILTQIDENLQEFKNLKEKLCDIAQEVKALSQLEDENSSLSDIGSIKVVGSSVSKTQLAPTTPPRSKTEDRRASIFRGDAISNLITMNRRHTIDSGSANKISSLVNQLHSKRSLLKISSTTSTHPTKERPS